MDATGSSGRKVVGGILNFMAPSLSNISGVGGG